MRFLGERLRCTIRLIKRIFSSKSARSGNKPYVRKGLESVNAERIPTVESVVRRILHVVWEGACYRR